MSAQIEDLLAVEYVKKFRSDLWTRHLNAVERRRPLTHEERIRDARASRDIYHHQHWPMEAIRKFGADNKY